jgi:hypothetical protein
VPVHRNTDGPNQFALFTVERCLLGQFAAQIGGGMLRLLSSQCGKMGSLRTPPVAARSFVVVLRSPELVHARGSGFFFPLRVLRSFGDGALERPTSLAMVEKAEGARNSRFNDSTDAAALAQEVAHHIASSVTGPVYPARQQERSPSSRRIALARGCRTHLSASRVAFGRRDSAGS